MYYVFVRQSNPNITETTTIHTITFEPKPQQNSMLIKCLAVNPKTYNFSREDSFKLNIVCKSNDGLIKPIN